MPLWKNQANELKQQLQEQLKTFSLVNVLMGVARPIFLPIALFTVLAYFGRWHQVLELLTHFRFQYFLGALFTLALYLFTQRRIEILICLTCVVLNGVWLVPWYWPSNSFTEGTALRVMVANVLTSNKRYGDFVQYVEQEKPDVLVVMELDFTWQEQLKALTKVLPYKDEYPSDDNFGIAIYSRYNLEDQGIHYWADGPYTVPSLGSYITVNQKKITLVATHPLPPLKPDYFQYRNQHMVDMANFVKQQKNPTIVMGDLNMSMWSPYYRDFIRSTGMKNTRQGYGIQPSWPVDAPLLQIPIDHCLISKEISVRNNRIGKDIGSDHHPLIADLMID
jgi:endonuclease/exonuclease/phosphatase (EEP) superfamily protein YafD